MRKEDPVSGKPLDQLMDEIAREVKPGPFQPCAWYNPEGDALEIYLSPDDFIAERVDTLFTVFVDPRDRQKVLGLAIKNIRKHFGPEGLKQIVLSTGKATVSMLVWAAVGAAVSHFNLQRHGAAELLPKLDRVQSLTKSLGSQANEPLAVENLEGAGV